MNGRGGKANGESGMAKMRKGERGALFSFIFESRPDGLCL
jgi:hypothetical protein